MYLKQKAFKCVKNVFLQFQLTFHMYLDIGRDNDDDYHDGESSDEN